MSLGSVGGLSLGGGGSIYDSLGSGGGGLSGGGSFGGGGLSMGSFGGGDDDLGSLGGGGFSGSLGGGGGGNLAVVRNGPSRLQFVPVASDGGDQEPTRIITDSISKPVHLVVRARSSGVSLDVQHVPSRGTFRQTASEDGPSVHVHTVKKPSEFEIYPILFPTLLKCN